MCIEGLEIQKEVYGPDHHLLAPTWLTTAKIFQAKKDYAQAQRVLQKATKLEQRAEKIRAIEQVAYGSLTKGPKTGESIKSMVKNIDPESRTKTFIRQ